MGHLCTSTVHGAAEQARSRTHIHTHSCTHTQHRRWHTHLHTKEHKVDTRPPYLSSFSLSLRLCLSLSLSLSPANGYISARASPGLLSVSNGNSLGKVVPAKSPPPPSPQMVNSRKPDLRVITSQSGKSLMQLVRTTTMAVPLGH